MEFQVDGSKVFAATGGKPFDPAKPSVVFLHGAGMDHTVWTLQTRYFAHHGRNALAIDLPGHGRSDGPGLTSIMAMADFVARACAALGIAEPALAGHSMGALVALDYASRFKARALALLGAAEAMPVHPKLLDAARQGDHAAIDMIADWGFGRAAQLGGAQAPGTWMVGGGVRLLETARGPALADDLAACDAYKAAPEAAAKIACPALVLIGTADRMTPPAGGRALAKRIAGSKTADIVGAGHMMMVEKPDATLDALASIL
jgi:pimeloyl-ACP methyl ester carboxylesterase